MKSKIKARRWYGCRPHPETEAWILSKEKLGDMKPVAVIPIDQPEELVAIAANAQLDACRAWFPGWEPSKEEIQRCREYASAGLVALGILPRSQTRTKPTTNRKGK